jgi:UDP-glucose 4-epimerase
MKHSRYGVVNWFIRLALDDATIPVFGDGTILRDFLYIDDCVQAMLACAASEASWGEVFNVGVDRPSNFRDLAELIVRTAGSGRWEFAPFSPERKAQEPGDFYSDVSKIRRMVGWRPTVDLHDGVRRTIEFYRAHRRRYW